jgi:type 1 glutamine amidotransferase
MKPIFVSLSLAVVVVFLTAQSPKPEKMPADAKDKIAEALPKEAYAKPAKPRRLLVFSKTNGFRHQSIPTGKHLLEQLGKQTGAFEAVISDDMAEFEADRLKTYDAVCFLSTTQNVFLPPPNVLKAMPDAEREKAFADEKRWKENFLSYIRNGGGFVGIHAATDTCHEWQEYGKLINGFFDGHPWNANTHVSIKVEPGQEAHPIVAMFEGKNVEFKEEIYQLKDPYDSKAVHMLLRLDTERSDMNVKGIKRTDGDFGVAWIRPWDKGRVFYSSLGHNHEIYWHPKVVRHFLAGIQWALGDYEAPLTVPK